MTEPVSEPTGRAPAIAPAPAPPLHQSLRSSSGFDPKAHRVAIEVVLVALAVGGLAAAAIWGSGSLAALATPLVPLSVDHALGEQAFQQTDGAVCPNPATQRYVERIAAPLLAAAAPLPFEFHFRVVDDPSINAFALPGGFVTVHRGLLEAAGSGEAVAGVLGHEIQHVLLRHSTRHVLRRAGSWGALTLLFGGSDVAAYAGLAAQLSHAKYDRSAEYEADREGVALLVRAGIDPKPLAALLEKLARGAPRASGLLANHPDPGDRVAILRTTVLAGPARAPLPAPRDFDCQAQNK